MSVAANPPLPDYGFAVCGGVTPEEKLVVPTPKSPINIEP
jgi:hypothetical protein